MNFLSTSLSSSGSTKSTDNFLPENVSRSSYVNSSVVVGLFFPYIQSNIASSSLASL